MITANLVLAFFLAGQLPAWAGYVMCLAPDHAAVEAASLDRRAVESTTATVAGASLSACVTEHCASAMSGCNGCVDLPLSLLLHSAIGTDASSHRQPASMALVGFLPEPAATGNAGDTPPLASLAATGPPVPVRSAVMLI